MNTPASCVEGLNSEQRAAVETVDGPLLILAGAGSGKTRVLTQRVSYLLATGVPAWQILAVTFTNKAAAEMRNRVRDQVGETANKVFVSTFHSACVRILRQDIEPMGFKRNFTIYDIDDQRRLVKQLLKDNDIDSKVWSPRKVMGIIDQAKTKMQDAAAFKAERGVRANDPAPRIFAAYEKHLQVANAVDFNDLLNHTVRLLQQHPAVLKRYQDRFRYIMVDEYQDTNLSQYLLIKLLAGQHRNLAVVGDDDQSIYAFRGANIRNILDFEKDFPEAKVVRLERNYRSTSPILEAAHGVVRNNGGRMVKKLWTEHEGGEKVRLVVAQDEMEEAARVLSHIQRGHRAGKRWSDFAIIYRTNAASRPFEQALVRARVPHILVGARKFYERREIRDMLGYLKLVLNPTDDMACLRVINVPSRGIGAVSIRGIRNIAENEGVPMLAAVERWARTGRGRARKAALEFFEMLSAARIDAREMPPGELVAHLAEASGYAPSLRNEETPEAQSRLENVSELARAVEEEPILDGEGSDHPMDRLQAFVDRASLAGQSDELPEEDRNDGQVTLLTAHLAKGLEFPVVFCTGMVEGGFPHHLSREREEDLEEERRLVYVAFTRAMRELIITRPRRRLVMGQGFQTVEPSRFLDEIPEHVITGDISRAPSWKLRRKPPVDQTAEPVKPAVPQGLFRTVEPEGPEDLSPGTRVMHPTFGTGVIRKAEGGPANLKLHIAFDKHGSKAVFARYARLEVLVS
jgi:DNA helicase-2/ATP-dependent DNA helicase PcrA